MGTTNFDKVAATNFAGAADGVVGGVTPAAGTFTTATAASLIVTGAVCTSGSVATGLTAHAGGTQAAALALTAAVNRVDTVGTAADSVALPAPTAVGQQIIVINNAASNSMQVFGSGTDTINGVATATGVAQAAGKVGTYTATSIGAAAAWFRNLSA